MGEVYRARDTKTDRIVALKLLPPQLAEDEVFQRRFRREAQAASGVNDPHVVPIHGYGEIDGRLYLDMRLIEGLNLGTILAQRNQPLGPRLASVVVEQVASALDSAHANGLVHRDVKPTNILISDREFVYLIDFGLARTTGEVGSDDRRQHPGNPGLHGPRAVQRRAERHPLRHLRADVRALRMSHRDKALPQ